MLNQEIRTDETITEASLDAIMSTTTMAPIVSSETTPQVTKAATTTSSVSDQSPTQGSSSSNEPTQSGSSISNPTEGASTSNKPTENKVTSNSPSQSENSESDDTATTTETPTGGAVPTPPCGPLTVPCPTLVPEVPPTQTTTTVWPWNDLNYDYLYMWQQYVQEIQNWANQYMVPIEHHNITILPAKNPTISPNSNRYQSEYESFLASFEKWEAKNRPYVPTTKSPTTTPTPLVVNPYLPQEMNQAFPSSTGSPGLCLKKYF